MKLISLMSQYKNQKGAAAVEFAIMLPVLVIILLGIIDFALLFYNKQVLANASREGARAAIVVDNREDPDNPGVINTTKLAELKLIIIDYCDGRLINLGGDNDLEDEPQFSFNTDPTTGELYIIATVTYDYDHLFFSFFGFGPTTLTGQTVMRSE